MPALDDRKLLPPGVHNASLKDVEELFGRFQRSDRRPKLFRKLAEFLKELKKADIAASVVLNGSFVMACVDEPEDIDLLLVLSRDWDWHADLKPYQYNLVSKRRIKRVFGFDAFPVGAASEDEKEWIEFFARINPKWCRLFGWPKDSIKGLMRVKP